MVGVAVGCVVADGLGVPAPEGFGDGFGHLAAQFFLVSLKKAETVLQAVAAEPLAVFVFKVALFVARSPSVWTVLSPQV